MKKQPSRAKTVTKARKTVVAKTKTAKRKGVIHHTKRIYHLTPKFVHGALIGAFFGMLLVTWISSMGDAHANPAANPCIKTNGPINVNLKNANVEVKTSDCNKNRTFVMKAWYAPSATGEPHDEQRLFAVSETVVVKKNDNNWTKINVKALPDGCFYQYDLVDITNEVEGDGVKNPIVRAAVGGKRDCTPRPEYSCNSMSVKKGADRLVIVDSFNVTAVNAKLDHVVVYWDFPNAQLTENYAGSAKGAQHQYTADGTYKIYAVAYFKITAKNGGDAIKIAKQACTAEVSFTAVTPGNQEVCEFSTGNIVQIPEGPYDTSAYGPPTAKECTTITVDNTSLTETGPAAVLVVLAFAAFGGYAFHRTHHHLKARKHRRVH